MGWLVSDLRVPHVSSPHQVTTRRVIDDLAAGPDAVLEVAGSERNLAVEALVHGCMVLAAVPDQAHQLAGRTTANRRVLPDLECGRDPDPAIVRDTVTHACCLSIRISTHWSLGDLSPSEIDRISIR